MTNEIATYPDLGGTDRDSSDALLLVHDATIDTREDYESYSAYGQTLHALEKKIKLDCNGTTSDPGFIMLLDRAHKKAVEFRDKHLLPIQKARATLASKLAGWFTYEQNRVREEQVKVEQRAREEEAARIKAEGGGKRDVAAILSGKTAIPTPVIAQPEQIKGVSMRQDWDAEVVDLLGLVKAVASGRVPVEAILPNTKFLRSQAKAMKGNLKYPGVRAVARETTAFRSS